MSKYLNSPPPTVRTAYCALGRVVAAVRELVIGRQGDPFEREQRLHHLRMSEYLRGR